MHHAKPSLFDISKSTVATEVFMREVNFIGEKINNNIKNIHVCSFIYL